MVGSPPAHGRSPARFPGVAASGRLCFAVTGSPGDVAVVNLTPVEAGGAGNGQLFRLTSRHPRWRRMSTSVLAALTQMSAADGSVLTGKSAS